MNHGDLCAKRFMINASDAICRRLLSWCGAQPACQPALLPPGACPSLLLVSSDQAKDAISSCGASARSACMKSLRVCPAAAGSVHSVACWHQRAWRQRQHSDHHKTGVGRPSKVGQLASAERRRQCCAVSGASCGKHERGQHTAAVIQRHVQPGGWCSHNILCRCSTQDHSHAFCH